MYHPIPPQVYVALGFWAVLILWGIVAGVTPGTPGVIITRRPS